MAHCAVNRSPNVRSAFASCNQGMRRSLERSTNDRIARGDRGKVVVNDRLQTSVKNVYAIGDVTDIKQLAHFASAQGKAAATPEEGWPDNTYSIEQKRLYFNDEPVVIMHHPANSDGNSIVLFHKSDVVSAGSMLDLTAYPLIDVEHGGVDTALF